MIGIVDHRPEQWIFPGSLIEECEESMVVIDISTKTASDISALIDTRQFTNAEEVVARAVDLLVQREHQVDHLKGLIAIAEDQVAHGDVVEMTASFWDDIDRDVDEALARGDMPSPEVCP